MPSDETEAPGENNHYDNDDTGGEPSKWPSWHLPVLQWVKAQGGITGTMHSGTGLQTASTLLPNYLVPPMNGIGAMSFFVDVTHGAVDFFATVSTRVIP